MLSSNGGLRIRAYTAGGALPVGGATVRIFGAEENNREVVYSLVTDRDGLTPEVLLPAPSVSYSLEPNPSEQPYALYDVEIIARGYFTRRINGLTVFPDISSVQLINMIPDSGNGMSDYPRGNINTVIPENSI